MRHFALLAALAAAIATAGCGADLTGGSSFTTTRAGASAHSPLVARYGGEIAAPTLSRYVADLGGMLTRAVGGADLGIRFTVLDSPVVNAFALSGGEVFVTRGLVELASDEAELAAVLAHELAHEEADRAEPADNRALLAVTDGLGAIAGPDPSGAPARPTATESAFSRDEEFAADARGIAILARAGYDPHAMARFLAKLRAEARVSATLHGQSSATVDRVNYLASHPATIERLERARALAASVRVDRPMVRRDAYLDRIDGLVYGDSPAQGVIRGRRFANATLRLAFEVPAGFRLFNASSSVMAYGPGGARIVFDRARDPDGVAPQRYLTDIWGGKIALHAVQAIEVNGTQGATALAHGTTEGRPVDVRLVALDGGDGTLFRMVFVTPQADTAQLAPALRRTTYSFARLSADEAARIRPLRLRVVTVAPGDTAARLAARMAFPDNRRERFDALNGLGPDARLAPGMRVKVVTAE